MITIDWMVIVSKILALFALVFFAKHSAKQMFIGKPSMDIREQVEHSLFVLVVSACLFHFFGRLAADAILSADMSTHGKRQLYYFFFSLHELLFVVAIIHWHNVKRCELAKITRYICYLSAMTICLQLLRYADRVIFEANYLEFVYRIGIAMSNSLAALLILIYPLTRTARLIPDNKWS
ncbi:hypothetical protein [Pseudoalteromonas byunsanensis]|uniref:Uncharacterized protein n=1 Tax=Pseudoalteromonas byunsanensis TaxID=327939 RepID=A0A1S1NFD7_9GAMM|nr:hypothetical protein [Pseudoalteromonas byunsanensis]OHU97163.1 hypothetical protein BIW53_02255 [Pseudoalteromonas byunsanensis]